MVSKDFSGLSLKQYQIDALLNVHDSFPFTGKRVVEFGADLSLQTACAMLRLGAASVYALNPALPRKLGTPSPQIIPLRLRGEESGLDGGCADMVFGLALLEHVHQPQAMAVETVRLLAPGGKGYLQGNPMWASWRGHHVWVPSAPSGRAYIFSQESNPFEPWEHLSFPDDAACIKALCRKGIPEEDSKAITHYCMHNPILSRLSSHIVQQAFLDLPDTKVSITRVYSKRPANEFYTRALDRYAEEELRTEGVRVWLEK